MKVRLPSPLHSYTGGRSELDAEGATLGQVLLHLEGRFPGMRFRMVDEQDRLRPHIQCFVAGRVCRDLGAAVGPGDEVMIVAALSGG
ncbi:MAG: MoaD/ThiS family protein [Planctomycetes bacterium]|nr:MoaD/ThiS family protein [Planctomycetota bacterium]